MSFSRLALDLQVRATRIGEILHERRSITASAVFSLSRHFKTNPEFRLNFRSFSEIEMERRFGTANEIAGHVHPAVMPAA